MLETFRRKSIEVAPGISVRLVDLTTVALLAEEDNPNKMAADQYEAMVARIRETGHLESVPYLKLVGGELHAADGNRRISAALEAGVTQALAFVNETREDVSAEFVRRLALNAIRGRSDFDGLRAMLTRVDPAHRLMTGVSARTIRRATKASAGDAVKAAKWVKLSDIFGPRIPPEAASVIREGVTKMTDAGDITDEATWRFIELLAADYLATPDAPSDDERADADGTTPVGDEVTAEPASEFDDGDAGFTGKSEVVTVQREVSEAPATPTGDEPVDPDQRGDWKERFTP